MSETIVSQETPDFSSIYSCLYKVLRKGKTGRTLNCMTLHGKQLAALQDMEDLSTVLMFQWPKKQCFYFSFKAVSRSASTATLISFVFQVVSFFF